MEEAIKKRCLSTPTKPSSKRAATFASPKRCTCLNTVENEGITKLKKCSNPHYFMTTVSTGQATSQASTEVDQRQQFQAELPSRAHLTSNQANDFSKCLDFSTGVDITESELLLYCLLVEAFPLNSFRARYHEKYLGISSAIENVLHVDFGSVGIANYLYRANNNLRRDLGKVKGVLRWKCYREKIERIVKNHPLALQALISSRDSTMETSGITLNELRNQLTRECSKERMGENAEEEEAVSETKFSIEALDTLNIDEFPNWKKCVYSENNTAHLFYYGGKSIGYPQIEVAINNEGFWKIRHEGRERKICLDWADVSPQINSIQDLDKYALVVHLSNFKQYCPTITVSLSTTCEMESQLPLLKLIHPSTTKKAFGQQAVLFSSLTMKLYYNLPMRYVQLVAIVSII